jgi:hypothetical protein
MEPSKQTVLVVPIKQTVRRGRPRLPGLLLDRREDDGKLQIETISRCREVGDFQVGRWMKREERGERIRGRVDLEGKKQTPQILEFLNAQVSIERVDCLRGHEKFRLQGIHLSKPKKKKKKNQKQPGTASIT